MPSRAALDSDGWRGARKCTPAHPRHKNCAAQRRERNSRVSRDMHARIRCTKSAPRRRESATLTQSGARGGAHAGDAQIARRTRFWRVRSPAARSQHERNDFKVASENSPRSSESAILSLHTRIRDIKKSTAQQREQNFTSSFGSRCAASTVQSHFERPTFRKTRRSGATRAKKLHRAEARAHPATRG